MVELKMPPSMKNYVGGIAAALEYVSKKSGWEFAINKLTLLPMYKVDQQPMCLYCHSKAGRKSNFLQSDDHVSTTLMNVLPWVCGAPPTALLNE